MSSSNLDSLDYEPPQQSWSAKCTCGKRFAQPNSYALHIGCCSVFKQRLGRNLRHARERHHASGVGLTSGSVAEALAGSSGQADSEVQPGVHEPAANSGSRSRKRVRPSWLTDDPEIDAVKSMTAVTSEIEEVTVPHPAVDQADSLSSHRQRPTPEVWIKVLLAS